MESHQLLQGQRRKQLSAASTFTRTCLPKSEAFFKQHQRKILDNHKWDFEITDGDTYRSFMDMVLCKVFPYYTGACKLFYLNKALTLNTRFSVGQLEEVDKQILYFLQGLTKNY